MPVTQFDEKGKFFTQVIAKKPVPVTIQTTSNRIRGWMHIRPNERVKDELNGSESFIAVTNATVLDEQGSDVLHCEFLTLNISHIIWVIPDDETESA